MKSTLFAAALSLGAGPALAAPEAYVLSSSHSQILFSYQHLGFSTTWGMFSGFAGDILFDAENPAASSVSVSMPTRSIFTGWQQRDDHFLAQDFLNAEVHDTISFVSTAIEVTGENTALITGDLTMNGITQPVVLDAKLNQAGKHPMLVQDDWAGFNATTMVLRSDFGMGLFAPMVSDEVQIQISVEAKKVK